MTIELAERALLERTVREAIGPDADERVLTELGWLDMLQAEPDAAIDIVFSALGAANASVAAIDDVVTTALAVEPRAGLAVLHPEFGSWHAPGRRDNSAIRARGIASGRAASAGEVMIVCDTGAELQAVVVPIAVAAIEPLGGADPRGGWHRVAVDTTAAAVGANRALERRAWDAAVGRSQRALGHQLAGATRSMLDLARAHALERVQFDRPVARFQAVRHRLAEALVAIEALEASLAAAADGAEPQTAALAKAVAGRTARTVAAHCQQVLAGIGFTTEHAFHRFLKRTMVIEGLYGSADTITLDLGRRLLATRTVPTLIEL